MGSCSDSPRTQDQVTGFVHSLATKLQHGESISSMSTTIYDTAWISMVSKETNGVTEWLFPRSFGFLLEAQSSDGSWSAYNSQVDGILNTMAAVLALERHLQFEHIRNWTSPIDIEDRIARGRTSLERQLMDWDVEATQHVGFEVLIPALLDMLENDGHQLPFPGRPALTALNRRKMSKFDPVLLYGKTRSTLIHSLEAFTGIADFNFLHHHLHNGSMMASPAATAAYLIESSVWDSSAEKYLKSVVDQSTSDGDGSVPSAFPSTVFELTWSISTLLEAHAVPKDVCYESLSIIRQFLEAELSKGHGVLGFVPGVLEDADDTAKTVLTLTLLDSAIDPGPMLNRFRTRDCFMTYVGESDPSFSANCNILNAMLHLPGLQSLEDPIELTITFLCRTWSQGNVKDKWNLSSYYSMMLLAQCLVALLVRWNQGHLQALPDLLIRNEAPLILAQITTRLLQSQHDSGAWGATPFNEETAYALIALKALASAFKKIAIYPAVQTSVQRATAYLEQHHSSWCNASYLWVEKLTYRAPLLAEAYCLAAVGSPSENFELENAMAKLLHGPAKGLGQQRKFFASLEILSAASPWLLEVSVLEASWFQDKLARALPEVFPNRSLLSHKFMTFVPITWTTIKNTYCIPATNDQLLSMMIVSALVYQVDEYMETTISSKFEHRLEEVNRLVYELCMATPLCDAEGPDFDSVEDPHRNGYTNGTTLDETLLEVQHVLSKFITWILNHQAVKKASLGLRRDLRSSLVHFLQAHLDQISDNKRIASQLSSPPVSSLRAPPRSLFDWVQNTSAHHTSCFFAFYFHLCLTTNGAEDCFTSPEQEYTALAASRHLATMCRMYNDWGSFQRDRDEGNLNCLDFPGFFTFTNAESAQPAGVTGTASGQALGNQVRRAKDKLMWLAQYERSGLELAMTKLREMAPRPCVLAGVELFVKVTDLYGQMYVARDLTSALGK